MQAENVNALISIESTLKDWMKSHPLSSIYSLEERTRYIIFLTDLGLRLWEAGQECDVHEILRYACMPVGTRIGKHKIHDQYEKIADRMLPVAITHLWGTNTQIKEKTYDTIL